MTPTNQQWTAFYLWHPDHQGLSLEKAAEEMGLQEDHVKLLLRSMRRQYPSLFVDISSDGRRFDHNVVRYGPGVDRYVKEKF